MCRSGRWSLVWSPEYIRVPHHREQHVFFEFLKFAFVIFPVEKPCIQVSSLAGCNSSLDNAKLSFVSSFFYRWTRKCFDFLTDLQKLWRKEVNLTKLPAFCKIVPSPLMQLLSMRRRKQQYSSSSLYYRVCYRFRLAKQDNYFWITFDQFGSECQFFETVAKKLTWA